MKIGITEQGDAGLDLSWSLKMHEVDAAVLITKCLNKDFIDTALRYSDKVIVHVTCTGLNILDRRLEPYSNEVSLQLGMANELVSRGFPIDRIVIRVDPIIPTDEGISIANFVIYCSEVLGFHNFRVSVIDMYPHVRKRFIDAGLELPFEGFQATDEQFKAVSDMLSSHTESVFSSCAEVKLTGVRAVGCISTEVLDKLNISYSDKLLTKTGNQRSSCLCLPCKTELLCNKHQCKNQCLYCYWKKVGE